MGNVDQGTEEETCEKHAELCCKKRAACSHRKDPCAPETQHQRLSEGPEAQALDPKPQLRQDSERCVAGETESTNLLKSFGREKTLGQRCSRDQESNGEAESQDFDAFVFS